jgi:hypothetical protein
MGEAINAYRALVESLLGRFAWKTEKKMIG